MTLVEKSPLLSVENFDLNENVEWFVCRRRTPSTVSIFPRKISEESLQTPEILVKSKKHSLISVAESNKRQYRLSHGRISFLSVRSWKPFSAAQPWSGLSFQRNLLCLCVKEKSVSNRRGRSVRGAPVSHRALPALHWHSLTGCLTLFHLLQSCARSAMPSVAQTQPVGRICPSAPCSAPLDPASPSCSSPSPPRSCWGWRWANKLVFTLLCLI